MTRILIGGETDGAGFHALAHELLHPDDFFRRRLAFHGVFAHHVMTHSNMADQRRRVDTQPGAENVTILARGSPFPLNAFFEHTPADRFDAHEAFDHRLAILRFRRRQAQSAIAEHRRRHAVEARRCAERIPKQLSVEMGVWIDEARSDG